MLKSTVAVTFGDGRLAHRRASRRLSSEFFRLAAVDSAVVANRKVITDEFPEMSNKIKWEARGLGYWAWKPLVGLLANNKLTGRREFVLYADSGCIINSSITAEKKFDSYLQMARESGALTFSSGNGNTDRKYCKGATFQGLLGVNADIDSPQRAGGVWLFHKDLAKDFMTLWWRFCSNIDLINDEISPREDPDFIEHRHDQAIFSLLAKGSGLPVTLDNIDFHPGVGVASAAQRDLPIWASRHRSGCRNYSMNPAVRALRALESIVP